MASEEEYRDSQNNGMQTSCEGLRLGSSFCGTLRLDKFRVRRRGSFAWCSGVDGLPFLDVCRIHGGAEWVLGLRLAIRNEDSAS